MKYIPDISDYINECRKLSDSELKVCSIISLFSYGVKAPIEHFNRLSEFMDTVEDDNPMHEIMKFMGGNVIDEFKQTIFQIIVN